MPFASSRHRIPHPVSPMPPQPLRILRPLRWGLAFVLAALLLIFGLIGVLHTFRGTPIERVRISGTGAARISVEDSSFLRTAEVLTGVQLTPRNRVELLLNRELLERLWSDLATARSTITIRNYYALPGSVADSLASILSERAGAGVRVQYLYDAFGSEFEEGYLDRLRNAGVAVQGFRPLRWFTLNRAQNRSHVRAIVIDGRIGYTGGFGFADAWSGDGLHEGSWRETSVRFTGPAVRQLQAVFAIGWAEATGTLLVGPRYFPPASTAAGSALAGVLYTTPTQGSTPAERFLVLAIRGAARTLYVTNSYFVPDDDQRRLLSEAARRGVDVRILTAGARTDMPLVRLAGRVSYESLLRAGVRIYEYTPTMIHAKTMVVDGLWATVGTMNFDYRSTALNDESNLVILDRGLGARLDSIFLNDLRHARELRLPEFGGRPWHQKLREQVAALVSRLL